MNNFELHSRAQELSASHSGYNLARRLLALEEELAEARRDASTAYEKGVNDACDAERRSQQAQGDSRHPDDLAVDRFAAAMKAKLEKSRDKGRGGWDDPDRCSVEFLADLLIDHMDKGNEGNFEDIANLCMMLHQRGASPSLLALCRPPAPEAVPEAVRDLISGVRSINRSKHQRVIVDGDDEPCYWQREEWVKWILSLADQAESSISAAPAPADPK